MFAESSLTLHLSELLYTHLSRGMGRPPPIIPERCAVRVLRKRFEACFSHKPEPSTFWLQPATEKSDNPAVLSRWCCVIYVITTAKPLDPAYTSSLDMCNKC